MGRWNNVWKKTGSFFSALRFCFVLCWKTSPLYTCLRLACNVLPSLLSLLATFLGKYILDVLSGAQSFSNPGRAVLLLSAGLLGIAALRNALQHISQYVESVHSELLNGQISVSMMRRAVSIDLEYFDNPEYYDRLTTCTQDAAALSYLLWNALSAVSACISFLVSIGLLVGRQPIYGLLMLVAAIPSSIASARYTKQLYELSLDQVNQERRKNYLQSVAMSKPYAQSIRFFHAGERLVKKYQTIWKNLLAERKNINRKRSIITCAFSCLPELVSAGISVDIALDVLQKRATIGDFSFYTGLATQLWSSIYTFLGAAMQLYDNQLKLEHVKTLDQFSNRIRDDGKLCLKRVDTIEFDKVYFTYPETDKQVLHSVSFCIHRGEKVALVGLNGSGKSTIIKLLLRMYDVDEGQIRINDMDIRKFRIAELHRNFSVYFQDEPSYAFSLLENLTIADQTHPEEESAAWAALRSSGCSDILHNLPNGLDTYLTRLFDDEGIELSGGQYQKLALARTFFRRHTALLLDEPSSNLDPRAEQQLFESLRELTAGKTVLFTSHRLSNVTLADRIVVLEYGSVLEDGTQEELLKKGGRFAELFHYQQQRYRTAKEENVTC